MSIYSALTRYASDWRAARDEAHTRRVLSGLPADVLKDIGYPEPAPRTARPFIEFGSWVGGR